MINKSGIKILNSNKFLMNFEHFENIDKTNELFN